MKERKSPLTTLDLASAILETASLKPEVLSAAQTLKELMLQGNKDNETELLGPSYRNMIKNPDEHLNNGVEKEDDIICLYRKANFDPDMKKAHDWKKLLEIAPGYTIHSVSDQGSKYMICLKKINITITTTVAPIVTTTVETPNVEVSGRKGIPPDNLTGSLNKTGETEDKELSAIQEDSYEDCDEDEGNENDDNKPQAVNENTTPESTIKETTTENEPPTVSEEPDNLALINEESTPSTEDVNSNKNVNINENVKTSPPEKKRKYHKPNHKKPTQKIRKNTRRRQHPMTKARKPKRNKNQIDPSYLDPTVRKGAGIRPVMKPRRILRNNRNLPVENLDPFGKVGYPVRVPRKRVSKKRKRLTAIPFVVTVSKIPINPVAAVTSFQDIYPETLPKVPCQDGYRKILFPIRLFNPLVPLCKPLEIVNQLPSSQPSPNNFPNVPPYAVMQPGIQSNLPNVLIPQEYPTQVLAPYVNNYEPPTEIRISVQQPLIEEEYSKNKKSNCDSQSAQLNIKSNMNRRSIGDNVNKMKAENATNAEVTVDTLSSTKILTGEDKTTTSSTAEAENETEIAEVRMALDDSKKHIAMTSEQSATTASSH